MIRISNRTGDMLLGMGVLTPAQLDIGLAQQKMLAGRGHAMPIGEVLVRSRFVRREDVALAIEKSAGGAADFTTVLPPALCARLEVVPFKLEEGSLWLKSAHPVGATELALIEAQALVPITQVRIVASDRQSIRQDLVKLAPRLDGFSALLIQLQSDDSGQVLRQALDALMAEAVEARASDIHLDSKPDPDSWVSFRIDGALVQRHIVPEKVMAALITRVKAEAGMDASNMIKAQDGRLVFEHRGRLVDFRVAAQPLDVGETVALRSLDAEALPSLPAMFPNQPAIVSLFQQLSKAEGKKGGIILVSGPTGSGKTTTLYALIRMLPRDSLNLMTVEDPVEYRLPFARQIQLNQLLDQKAEDFERSLLRQDPDIIMLGEIRDDKSANAALKFAESGHMVLATLHADGATQVFERFAGFFEGPAKKDAIYVLTQHLHVTLHQQLSPKLCGCHRPITEEAQSQGLAAAGADWLPLTAAARQRGGCSLCGDAGYLGRVLLHETLVIPRAAEVRREVSRVLSGGLINAHAVTQIPGVTYVSRRETVRQLYTGGVIDLDLALRGGA